METQKPNAATRKLPHLMFSSLIQPRARICTFPPKPAGLPSASAPLRLLFVATSSGNGGIERHSVLLAEWIKKRGADILYACPPESSLSRLCGAKDIKTAAFAVRNSSDFIAAFFLARLILRQNSNVVHVHSRKDYVVAVLAMAWVRMLTAFLKPLFSGRSTEVPVLVLHAHLLKKMGDPAWLSGRFFERGAQAVIAVSEATQAFLIARHQLLPSFITLIHNGIDISRYDLPPQIKQKRRVQVRKQWRIPEDALVVGMIGRLDAKGQKRLLAVSADLLAKVPQCRLVFLGPEGRAGDLDSLQQTAEEKQITGQVVFAGVSEDIPSMLAGMDVVVHLPEEEAFGLVLIEAMAAGLPVISTNIGGCREVVDNEVTGIWVGTQDDNGLLDALQRLLAPGAADLRQRMGHAGRCRTRRLFSIEQQVESLERHYYSLLKPTTPAGAALCLLPPRISSFTSSSNKER